MGLLGVFFLLFLLYSGFFYQVTILILFFYPDPISRVVGLSSYPELTRVFFFDVIFFDVFLIFDMSLSCLEFYNFLLFFLFADSFNLISWILFLVNLILIISNYCHPYIFFKVEKSLARPPHSIHTGQRKTLFKFSRGRNIQPHDQGAGQMEFIDVPYRYVHAGSVPYSFGKSEVRTSQLSPSKRQGR